MLKKLRLLRRIKSLESALEQQTERLERMQKGSVICAGKCGGLFWGPAGKLCKLTGTDLLGKEVTDWVCIRCRTGGLTQAIKPRQRRVGR